jgi:hypothetical protein
MTQQRVKFIFLEYQNFLAQSDGKPHWGKFKYKKSKVHPITCHEGREGEQRYSPTLSLTLVLDGGGWLTSRPGRFTPGMIRYPLYRRLCGPRGWSGWLQKISPPPGFDPRTVQPVASLYTD